MRKNDTRKRDILIIKEYQMQGNMARIGRIFGITRARVKQIVDRDLANPQDTKV